MSFCRAAFCLVVWASICGTAPAQSEDGVAEARGLVEQSASRTEFEYCGTITSRKIDYYLFALEQNELSGLVLVQRQAGTEPIIVAADTSLSPFGKNQETAIDAAVLDGVATLLNRRNRTKENRAAKRYPARNPEVSFVGDAIDRIIYPICGFRLESNSTREILRRLRNGPATEVEPGSAPPGSIMVSPTCFSRSGPIYLGHAGIVGRDGSIDSADAHLDGAWVKNFSIATWLKRFSGNNGCYAFVLRALPKAPTQNQ